MTPGAEIKLGPHWWKASALPTRPTLPPLIIIKLHQPIVSLTIPFFSFIFTREIKALQEIEDNQNVCNRFSYFYVQYVMIDTLALVANV